MEALTPMGIGGMLFAIFFLLLLIGCPIMVALGVGTMACFLILGIDLSLMIERAFASLTAFPLMALPAFVLAGALLVHHGTGHGESSKPHPRDAGQSNVAYEGGADEAHAERRP